MGARTIGGLYRYYRCTRKNGACCEPYIQEGILAQKCLERLQPLAITKEEATEIRAVIDLEEQKESTTIKDGMRKIDTSLSILDDKLRTLTRRLTDEIIDEDMYRAMKEELLVEKASLTHEKNRLRREACNYWIEPSRTLISHLETLGVMPDTASLHEFANIVRKIGTNPLISNKTVTFSFSENYDFIPPLLAGERVGSAVPAAKRCGDSSQSPQSSKWCPGWESNPHDLTIGKF